MAIAIIISITVLAGWIAWLEFGRDREGIVMFVLDDEEVPLTVPYVNCITRLYSNKLITKHQAHRYLGVDSFE